MIERIEHLANDLQFEQKERDATPTLNLHLLKPQPADEKSEAICALCQDPIKSKDLCYKLPHAIIYFMRNRNNALEDAQSLLGWKRMINVPFVGRK